MKISIRTGLDWGCRYTDADAASFAATLVAAVAAHYSCEVEHEYVAGQDTRAWTDGDAYADDADDDEVRETVRAIAEDVWERGAFWADLPAEVLS